MLLTLFSLSFADCQPVDLREGTNLARESLRLAEPEQALKRAEQLKEALICLPLWVSPEDLALLFETGGIAATYAEDSSAGDWWARRRVLGEQLPLSSGLSADVLGAYRQATAAHSGRYGSLSADLELRVDGWTLRPEAPIRLLESEHFVQYRRSDGSLENAWVLVAAEGNLHVGPLLSAHSPARLPLALVGSSLIAAGTTSLLASGLVLEQGLEDPGRAVPNANGMRFGGAAAVGVGLTGLIVALLLK